ncbi:hypothetical protein [Amycolatopsis benzoatilytica]|uniref:hypothetical protein n=1 Tax=Amycolatopsis benzoatilytica TaxID=346045 RepID=UPI00037582BA|nr:hypothetical protein [Amycolatopsis benzoatilytica]
MQVQGLLSLADQRGEVVLLVDGPTPFEQDGLGGALDQLLRTPDRLGGVVVDGALNAVEVVEDRRRVAEAVERDAGQARRWKRDDPVVDLAAVAAQRLSQGLGVLLVELVHDPPHGAEHSADLPGISPVHGLEVVLGRRPPGAAVVPGGVRVRGEAFVLERRGDATNRAVGRQGSELTAGGAADQLAGRAHASSSDP